MALVQHTSSIGVGGSTTLNWGATPSAGNLLYVYINILDTSSTLTGPAGYAQVGTDASGGTTNRSRVYTKAAAGNEVSVSASKTGTASSVSVTIAEISNVNTTADQNGNSGGAGAVTTLLSASLTPSGANWYGIYSWGLTSTAQTGASFDNSFVVEESPRNFRSVSGDRTVVGGSGAYSTTGTVTGGGTGVASGIFVIWLATAVVPAGSSRLTGATRLTQTTRLTGATRLAGATRTIR